jgi:HTH-type transcriptional regulator / antitoxin HipB
MRISSIQDLASLVRSRRKAAGLTQADLATRIGVKALWVSQFERGKSTAQVGLVLRALKVLDIDLWTGNPTPSTGRSSKINLDRIIHPHHDQG